MKLCIHLYIQVQVASMYVSMWASGYVFGHSMYVFQSALALECFCVYICSCMYLYAYVFVPTSFVLDQAPWEAKASGVGGIHMWLPHSTTLWGTLRPAFCLHLYYYACKASVNMMDSIMAWHRLCFHACVSPKDQQVVTLPLSSRPCALRCLVGTKTLYVEEANKQHSWCLHVLIHELEAKMLL